VIITNEDEFTCPVGLARTVTHSGPVCHRRCSFQRKTCGGWGSMSRVTPHQISILKRQTKQSKEKEERNVLTVTVCPARIKVFDGNLNLEVGTQAMFCWMKWSLKS